MRARAAWLLAVALLGPGIARAQPVNVKVASVGFRAESPNGRVVRRGQWIPILFELVAPGSANFNGVIAVECSDLDGDRVSFRQPVVVTAGGGLKRAWLYAVTPRPEAVLQADLLDDNGATVQSLDLPVVDVASDELLVLDLSEPAALVGLGQADALTNDAFAERRFYRDVAVVNLAPEELPDQWFGLEAIDVVVWDTPDPRRLNAAQSAALIEWVRRGGQLVLGLGSSWDRVRKSELAQIVPLAGDTQPVATRELPRFRSAVSARAVPAPPREHPIEVSLARMSRGTRILWDRLPGGARVDLIVMDLVDSGRVTAVAAGLADLSAGLGPTERLRLHRLLLDLNPVESRWRLAEKESHLLSPYEPYAELKRPIDFGGVGQFFAAGATGFLLTYGIVATWGSWVWLRRRARLQWSWSLFAGCAIAASALSLGAVAVTRGRTQVNSISIIDTQAGATEGRAACWFGYRSPRRERVHLALTGGSLRALTPTQEGASQYAAPARYHAIPSDAALMDVPMRASLKQFEGYWSGPLDGAIRAQLEIDRTSGQVTAQSWIRNDLPADLDGGWLLYLDPRLSTSPRASGTAANHRGDAALPADNVLMVAVGPLPAGTQTPTPLGAAEYALAARREQDWLAGDQKAPRPDLPSLRNWQTALPARLGGFVAIAAGGSPADLRDAVLIASTWNLDLNLDAELKNATKRVSIAGMADLDVSHWLLSDQLTSGWAILIVAAFEPGPANLARNGQPLPARSGVTFYRVRIPYRLTGRAPPPAADVNDAPADAQPTPGSEVEAP